MRFVRAHVPAGEGAAAAYLAWVAYPSNEDARRRFAHAAWVLPFKVAGKHPPSALRGWKAERVEPVVQRGIRRIATRRIPAVWMACHQWHLSADDEFNGWGLKESARALVAPQGAANPSGGSVLPETMEPDNVRARVWRESLPALAMTLALPLNLADRDRRLDPKDLLYRDDWTADAIEAAQQLAPFVARSFTRKRLLIPYR